MGLNQCKNDMWANLRMLAPVGMSMSEVPLVCRPVLVVEGE